LIAWVVQAISELEPGQITGYLSAIFRDIIKLLAQEFGYDPSNIQAAPVCLPLLLLASHHRLPSSTLT